MTLKLPSCLLAFLFPLAVFAGGPDPSLPAAPSWPHFWVGVQGGIAGNIAQRWSRYTRPPTSVEDFNTTAFAASGIVGVNAATEWHIGDVGALRFWGSVNRGFATVRQTDLLVSNMTPTDEDYDLRHTLEPTLQYNVGFGLSHLVTNSFVAYIDTGFSTLRVKDKLKIADASGKTGGSSSAVPVSNKLYLAGAMLGFGFSFLCSAHSAIHWDFDYYIYPTAKLSTIRDIDTGGDDSLSKRKLFFSMPTLMVGYSLSF